MRLQLWAIGLLCCLLPIGVRAAEPNTTAVDAQPAFHPRMRHKPRIIHNEDADGATRDRRPAQGTVKEQTAKWFDELLTTTPTDVVIYSSAYCDLVWLARCPTGEKVYARAGLNAEETTAVTPASEQMSEKRNLEELWGQNTDVLDIAIERAGVHQKLVLAEMRMSDYHHGGVRPECYLCPKSVLDHPEWRIGPDIGLLNYAHRGVRDHYLTILREIVTNYKVDGVELNWFRFGRHFPAGQQREHASILSSWLVEVRGMLDEVARAQGRPRLLLTHIVPATVDESLNLGCDVTAWIKDGLADIVMPSDFLNADFNLRTEQFAQAAKGTNSLIYPMLFPAMAGGIGLVTADNCTAQAANYWKWGADGIATFNMYALGMPWVQRLYPLVESPQAVRAATRHYQFVRATSGSRPIVFDKMNERYVFSFRMAETSADAATGGILSWRIYGATNLAKDGFEFDLNGVGIPSDRIVVKLQPGGETVVRRGSAHGDRSETHPRGFVYEVRLADCRSLAGDNELGVRWVAKDESNSEPRSLTFLEAILPAEKP